MAVAAGVIGAGMSLYQGIESSRREDRARADAERASESEQAQAAQDKAWYDSNIRPFLGKTVMEAMNPGLTESGKLAQDQYVRGIGTVQRKIDAQGASIGADSGINQARQEALQLEQAKGLAEINLRDAVTKRELGLQGSQLAGYGSQADREQMQALQSRTNYLTQEQRDFGQSADEGWAGLASGMQAIARSYAQQKAQNGQGTHAEATPNPNTQTAPPYAWPGINTDTSNSTIQDNLTLQDAG